MEMGTRIIGDSIRLWASPSFGYMVKCRDCHVDGRAMSEHRYLDSEKLARVNELVLREIKVRKADRPRVLSRAKLENISTRVRETEGDLYDKATALIIGLIQGHPFASGNRRTAFVATKLFLELNGEKMIVEHDPKILQSIREGFYTALEVKSWLKGRAVKRFTRG